MLGMEERGQNIAIGITAIIGMVGLAFMLLLFGYLPGFLERGYPVQLAMTGAAGLSEGSRVKLDGVDVGRVVSVELQRPPGRGVQVNLLIRNDIRVPAAAAARVEEKLLGGSPTIIFTTVELTDEQLTTYLPTDGSAKVTAESMGLMDQVAADLAQRIDGFLEEVRAFRADFTSVGQEWKQVATNINQLVEPRTTDEVAAGATANLSTLIARADTRLTELQQVLDSFNAWVGDKELRADVKDTVAGAKALVRQSSDTLKQTGDKLDASLDEVRKLSSDAGRRLEELTEKYAAVADQLDRSLTAVRTLVEKAGTGDGTVAKLLNDPALYNNLNDAAINLQEALDEVKLLLQKTQKEGIPVKF